MGGVTPRFQRFAGWCAVSAAALGVSFTATFAAYVREGYHWAQWASSIALMLVGVVTVPVLLALHERLRDAEPQFSVLGLVTGIAGALGATVHGAYDVAVLTKPPGTATDFPNQVDPRGFATFALAAAALAIFGWLALRSEELPRRVGQLALATSALLLVVYLGRLITLDPNTNVIKASALLVGLVVSPAFYVAFARNLLQAAPERA
jgi:hypothetical protein